MPNVHPLHMRRAFRRARRRAAQNALLDKPGPTADTESHRALWRREAKKLSPAEIGECMDMIRRALRDIDLG